MIDGKITYSDAEKSVDDGSYKSASDETLREMRKACLNVGGSNVAAVDRVRRKGDIIQEELSAREKAKEQQESAPALSGIDGSETACRQMESTSDLHLWSESRLQAMIQDGIEETFNLEYKAAPALSKESRKTSEITKDISSMANSAGGILVYGIAQFQDPIRRHLPEKLDPISRASFSKEWLEHIISQIRPRINGAKIYSVQLSASSDHVAYIVEIPQGSTAHQANDFRYYRRYNFEAVPMLDHEVRDVMSRKAFPQLSLSAKLFFYPRPNSDGIAGTLTVTVKNTSDVFARYVAFTVRSPLRIRGRLISYNETVLEDLPDGAAYRLSFSNHIGAPLFPRGAITKNFQFKFPSQMEPEPGKQIADFRWVLFADSMPKQNGVFSVDELMQKP